MHNANVTDPVNFDGFQFIGSVTASGTNPSFVTTSTGKGSHLLGGGSTEFSVTDGGGLLTISTILRDGSTSYPGAGALRKTGLGTLALTAANVFTGITIVEAGTLALTGSLASATTVASSGKLSGIGTITAAVTVQSGGTLTPHPGATLTTGALTLASGSSFVADGKLAVSGSVDITGAQLATTVPGPRVLIRYTGTRSGEFATTSVPVAWQILVDDTAKEIRLVPTPAGYASWIAEFTTGGESGFNQNADHDGFSNGLEFLFGGDPSIAGDTPAPNIVATPGGGFTYTFTRTDRARGNCTVTAELGADLVTWPAANDIIIGTSSDGTPKR